MARAATSATSTHPHTSSHIHTHTQCLVTLILHPRSLWRYVAYSNYDYGDISCRTEEQLKGELGQVH